MTTCAPAILTGRPPCSSSGEQTGFAGIAQAARQNLGCWCALPAMDGTLHRDVSARFEPYRLLLLPASTGKALLRLPCSVVPAKPHDDLLTLHLFAASE